MARRRRPVDRPAHRVAVEVLALRAGPGSGLSYRRRIATLQPDGLPDDAAAALLGRSLEGGVLHSTSWRRDPAWGLVLTYVAVPDEHAADTSAVPIEDLVVAAGGDPVAPSPAAVSVDQVVAHAVRHLALLRHTDAAIADVLSRHPALDATISAADPLPAGQFS